MTDSLFYGSAVPMNSLDELRMPDRFAAPPADCLAVVTDVIGSTAAVASGRYKDVNLVGAAVIPAIIEGIGLEVPYIFTGDGALLLIPATAKASVETILSGVVHMAEHNFKLGLRAAIVSLEEMHKQGYTLEIGRLVLIGNKCLAQFRGSMVVALDKHLKSPEAQLIKADAKAAEQLQLNSLSCRWNEHPSRNGEILTIVLLPRTGDTLPASEFLALLNEITDNQLTTLNPVSGSLANYQNIVEAITSECRLHARLLSKSFLRRLVSIAISVPLFKWGLSKRYDWAQAYLKNLHQHSDFHKLDDALRLVIDCTRTQADRVVEHLEHSRKAQRIFYGVHRGKGSQITCYVESLSDEAHVHFVDGTDGGYVAAASQMKAQIAFAADQSAAS